MIRNIHKTLGSTRSAFAEVSIAAIIIWIGDILCVVADIGWLIGDMSIQVHTHHYFVMATLIVALILIVGSGIWLYKGVNRYLEKHHRIKSKKKKRHPKPKHTIISSC